MQNLNDQAVKAALNQDWNTAIDLNKQILKQEPENIATLNRLGFAYMQNGNLQSAKEAYNQVIKLDKFNPIANKSLDKISKIKHTKDKDIPTKVVTSFLEEPGKTKTVNLLRPADSDLLASLNVGTLVSLQSKKRRVQVETLKGKYLGCLPDDLGFKLGRLIKLGYTYEAVIKSADNKNVSIFIKELKRAPRGKNLPSFTSSSSILLSLPKTEQLDETPIDITPTGEEDEHS